MCPGMGCKVITAPEAATTLGAGIRSCVGVAAHVARQLVGAGKAPRTAGPCTLEGSLARVCAAVCLEVRGLGVALRAARQGAGVGTVG